MTTRTRDDLAVEGLFQRRSYNGVTVSFSDQGAEVFDAMSGRLKTLETEKKTLQDKLDETTKLLDDAKGRLSVAEQRNSDVKVLDAAVEERTQLLLDAKAIAPSVETKGRSNLQIMQDCLTEATGQNQSEATLDFCRGAWSQLLKDEERAAVRRTTQTPIQTPVIHDSAAARAKFIAETRGRG
jgi:hypothetical protein